MGQFSMGKLLVLGSERDVVFDYLVYLCHDATCQENAWVVRETNSVPIHPGVYGCYLHLFWRQLSVVRLTQLRSWLVDKSRA